MWRAPLDERAPLLDAEPVLLVDDRYGEPRELDTFLDERMRSHDQIRVGIRRALDRARQQGDTHAELCAERLDREEVLLRERLRRCHQRALAVLLRRAQERMERDDSLAGADVSLKEPLHGHGARQVGVDLLDRTLLM